MRKIWTWCLNAAHQQERYLLSTTSCRRMMLVLHISAESVKRLQHICILDALRSPERERKCSWSVAAAGQGAAPQPELELSDSFLKHTIVLLSQCTIICLWLLSFQQDHSELMKYSNILVRECPCTNITYIIRHSAKISRFSQGFSKIVTRICQKSAKILQKILRRFHQYFPIICQYLHQLQMKFLG